MPRVGCGRLNITLEPGLPKSDSPLLTATGGVSGSSQSCIAGHDTSGPGLRVRISLTSST
jgi:hypothetical protein